MAEQDAAKRPHDEATRKDHKGIDHLRRGIGFGEKIVAYMRAVSPSCSAYMAHPSAPRAFVGLCGRGVVCRIGSNRPCAPYLRQNAYRCAAPERRRRQNRTTPARCPRRSRPQHAAFAAALQRRTQIVARVSTVSQTPRRGSDAPAWASAHCSSPPSPPIVAGGCVLSSMVVQTLLLEGFPRKNI